MPNIRNQSEYLLKTRKKELAFSVFSMLFHAMFCCYLFIILLILEFFFLRIMFLYLGNMYVLVISLLNKINKVILVEIYF